MGESNYEQTRWKHADQKAIDRRERAMVRQMLAQVAAPGQTVLDVPSGFGRFTTELVEQGLRPAGADLEVPMISRTRERLGADCWAYVRANLKGTLPFKPGSFDGAFCMRLFHHVRSEQERAAMLSELGRVVRGWALISFYAFEPLHWAQWHLRTRTRPGKGWIAMIPTSRFLAEVRAAGLEPVECRAVMPVLHAHRLVLCRKKGAETG